MPKLVATHEVDDVEHWLASPKREEVFAGVGRNITTYVHPTEPNRVSVTMEVDDMAAMETVMASDAGKAAMEYDGVRPETIVLYIER